MMRISCPLTLPLASNPPPLVVVLLHVIQYGLRSQILTPVSDRTPFCTTCFTHPALYLLLSFALLLPIA